MWENYINLRNLRIFRILFFAKLQYVKGDSEEIKFSYSSEFAPIELLYDNKIWIINQYSNY